MVIINIIIEAKINFNISYSYIDYLDFVKSIKDTYG
jgi:hypothetical protein